MFERLYRAQNPRGKEDTDLHKVPRLRASVRFAHRRTTLGMTILTYREGIRSCSTLWRSKKCENLVATFHQMAGMCFDHEPHLAAGNDLQ